jgi:hypothetical protein
LAARFLAVAALAGIFSSCGTLSSTKDGGSLAPPLRKGERPGVAVVELFTSEGCSSCPAAEEVFDQLVEEARTNGEQIFPIAYHVDYWDEIGWKDPWSSALFTARQGEYARAWGRTSMYTPEAIVDGQDEMNGSDDAGLRAAIARALDRPAILGVEIERKPGADPRLVELGVKLSSSPSDARLIVALLERDLTSAVTAGENKGQTLHHTNVVRSMEVLLPSPVVAVHLAVPPGLRLDHASVVAWVQRTNDARIIGAASSDLP